MNKQSDWDGDARLDRLVDGELAVEEYRELLRDLDDEPDGWRRCAMSFLEAQALGQEFRALQQELETAPEVVSRGDSHRSTNNSGLLVLAMAASFLVAFGLGAWWRSPSQQKIPNSTSIATEDHESGAGTQVARHSTESAAESDASSRGTPHEQLTFVVDRGDGETEKFDMPVYAEDDAYARWMMEQPSMPVEVERSLRRAGYRVETAREWTPVRLRDGRRAIFPVDELRITPVSNRTY